MLSVKPNDLTINQYFHKVKTLCREISELDPDAKIADARMRCIIIHGLKPRYRGFITAVQGWPTQPSLVEFENLLADQEVIAKEIGGGSLKGEEDVLFTNKNRERPGPNAGKESKRSDDKPGGHH